MEVYFFFAPAYFWIFSFPFLSKCALTLQHPIQGQCQQCEQATEGLVNKKHLRKYLI